MTNYEVKAFKYGSDHVYDIITIKAENMESLYLLMYGLINNSNIYKEWKVASEEAA